MTVKRALLDRLPNQSHFFNAGYARKKLTPAGPDHAQIGAAAGLATYFDAVYEHHFAAPAPSAERGRQLHDLFQAHERALLTRLLSWLSQRDDIRIVGPTDPAVRAPTVSLIPLNKSLTEVQDTLTTHKLMTGIGDFYAVRPLTGMDIAPETGVLRLSFVHYTTEAEIEQLIEGLVVAL